MIVLITETTEISASKIVKSISLDVDNLYRGVWIAVSKLPGSAPKEFYLWLLSRVEDEGYFKYNKDLYLQFCNDMEANFGRKYEQYTVDDALRQMTKANVITRKSRGIYQINNWLNYTIRQ